MLREVEGEMAKIQRLVLLRRLGEKRKEVRAK